MHALDSQEAVRSIQEKIQVLQNLGNLVATDAEGAGFIVLWWRDLGMCTMISTGYAQESP